MNEAVRLYKDRIASSPPTPTTDQKEERGSSWTSILGTLLAGGSLATAAYLGYSMYQSQISPPITSRATRGEIEEGNASSTASSDSYALVPSSSTTLSSKREDDIANICRLVEEQGRGLKEATDAVNGLSEALREYIKVNASHSSTSMMDHMNLTDIKLELKNVRDIITGGGASAPFPTVNKVTSIEGSTSSSSSPPTTTASTTTSSVGGRTLDRSSTSFPSITLESHDATFSSTTASDGSSTTPLSSTLILNSEEDTAFIDNEDKTMTIIKERLDAFKAGSSHEPHALLEALKFTSMCLDNILSKCLPPTLHSLYYDSLP